MDDKIYILFALSISGIVSVVILLKAFQLYSRYKNSIKNFQNNVNNAPCIIHGKIISPNTMQSPVFSNRKAALVLWELQGRGFLMSGQFSRRNYVQRIEGNTIQVTDTLNNTYTVKFNGAYKHETTCVKKFVGVSGFLFLDIFYWLKTNRNIKKLINLFGQKRMSNEHFDRGISLFKSGHHGSIIYKYMEYALLSNRYYYFMGYRQGDEITGDPNTPIAVYDNQPKSEIYKILLLSMLSFVFFLLFLFLYSYNFDFFKTSFGAILIILFYIPIFIISRPYWQKFWWW